MAPPVLPAPDVQHWQPATLRERGVAVPFTTPALAGARIRLLERRADLIVPNPGGVRGVYVFALGSLAEFCKPTLHDSRLVARLAALSCFTPGSVREAAGAVALEGAAGRPAAAAAAASAALQQQREAAYLNAFLAALQASPQQGAGQPGHNPAQNSSQQAIQNLAKRTGRSPEAVMADIALLAATLARSPQDGPAAPGGRPTPGRGQNLLAAIAAFAGQVEGWSNQGGQHAAAAPLVAAARTMHEAGSLVLAAGARAVNDPAALLSGWALSQANVTALVAQPDWLLDGWEHICLLWRVSELDAARAAALSEAGLVLPPVPADAALWCAGDPGLQTRLGAIPHTLAGGAAPQNPGAQAPGSQAGGAQNAGAQPASAPGIIGRDPSQAVSLTARNERVRSLAA